jgi:hypothetical protein
MELWEEEELYLAGERVPPGRYRRVDSNQEIVLESEDHLPASLDGHVACYIRICSLWSQQPPQAEHCFRLADAAPHR